MTASMAGAGARMSRVRWTVCALLFFATTISYLDRQVLSFLAKTLETSLGWNSIQYGYITAAFSAAYAIGLLIAGRLMDKLGTRRGFALAMGVWSLAAAATRATWAAAAPQPIYLKPPHITPAKRSWLRGGAIWTGE